MGCINVCGISRKFNPFKNFLAQDKISILAISETHTVKSIVGPKFHCYQRNSEINPTRSGGVALLVAQNLASTPHTLPNHLNHLAAVAANLHLQNMSILIISYYNRPQDRVSADLLRYTAQHNFAIVFGDFNARHTDFGDTQTNPNGGSLNSLIITLPLCRLHNTDPTFLSHTGCSISDHILSTENFVPFLYPHCSIGTTVTSDHVPLKTHLLLDGLLTVDRQVAQFTEVLKTAQSQSIPRKFIPINKCPIPAGILALIREKRRAYRSFIQTRDPALKTIFNRLNAQVRRDLNRFREEQWIDSCRLLDYRNGKKFWTQFQTLTVQKTTTVHHLVRNNAIINTP
jgi:endonuclease/exonuclease/phosphatase family metal-dependent hydrolase